MSETENHLIKLQTYLSKQLRNRPGAQCIRNELVTTYLRNNHEESMESFKSDRTCPRCFNVWSEGHFSIKSKSKKSKPPTNKRIIIKCLVCGNSCVIHHPSGKRGARWQCSENREISRNPGGEWSGRTQKRKFEATSTSNMGMRVLKRKKGQIPSQSNDRDCGKILRKMAPTETLKGSSKRKRKRKSMMTSEFNRTPAPSTSSVTDVKRKTRVLNVLSDFL